MVKVNVDQKAVVAAAKKDLKVLATAKNELKSKIFNLEKKYDQAIFDSILSERASRRQGTHKTKNRAEVSGTGKKPFAQKGTGNARAGTLRAPHHVGGGVARGVHNNRNYNLKVNKKVKKLALKASLTNLAQQNGVLIKDMAMETISTKSLLNMLEEHNANFLKHILIVSDNKNLFLSARNLKNIKVTKVTSLQVEDLSLAHLLILDAKDVKTLEGVLA